MFSRSLSYVLARSLCSLCVVTLLAVTAQAQQKAITVADRGTFTIDHAEFQIGHYGAKWGRYTKQSSMKTAQDFPQTQAKEWSLQGILDAGGVWQFCQKIQWQSENTFDYHVTLDSDKPIVTESLAMEITLPMEQYLGGVLYIDGKRWQLPTDMTQMSLYRNQQVHELIIHSPQHRITLTGSWDLYIQDNRKFANDTYVIRLALAPGSGQIDHAALDMSVSLGNYAISPIALGDAANTAFADETANDRKGGWTDQGDNDLCVVPTGKQQLGGVPFEILSDAQTQGKSCIVLAGPDRGYLPTKAVIHSVNRSAQSLHMLHALAWTPRRHVVVGNITVDYADATQQIIPVTCGNDLEDWWLPAPVDNGMVAWSGDNAQNKVGLYRSTFPLQYKLIDNITFESTTKAVWMIAAVSAGDDLPIIQPGRYTITANENWSVLEHQVNVQPGSVLDFSFMQDAPAGKFGRVKARNGHMVFEQQPDKPVRFYGSNICFSTNYLSKDHVHQLVQQMRSMGYNTVRIHHYDRDLIEKNAVDSVTLDTDQLDKLDYLFAEMKKAGIYISMDLYTIRPAKKGEIAGLDRVVALQEYKVMAAIHEGVLANWKTFARNLLAHVNPYTQMRWMDDPALLNICLLNEDNLYAYWTMARQDYETALDHYLAVKKIIPRNAQHRDELMQQFLWQAQLDLYQRCSQFVKQELGVKTLISDLNMHDHIALGLIRDRMDYVENHAYWDHPKYFHPTNRLPLSLSNVSAITREAAVPSDMMASRLLGKPFGVTEYNFCPPNHDRAESGPLMGAYAALQDWQMIHRFAWSHWAPNTLEPKRITSFDIVTDPIAILSDRIATLLFLRGDVSPAHGFVPYVANDQWIENSGIFDWNQGRVPHAYARLGLITRIGMVRVDAQQPLPGILKDVPLAVSLQKIDQVSNGQTRIIAPDMHMMDQLVTAGMLDASARQSSKGIFTSQTGQIRLNAPEGQLTIATQRSACIVMPDAGNLSAGDISVTNNGQFGTMYVGSLNDQPIPQSNRLLVLHLTDVANSGLTFANRWHTKLLQWGDLPHLVRKGSMTVRIRRSQPQLDRVWRVDMAGKRIAQVPVTILSQDANGEGITGIAFEANTVETDGNALVYEVQKMP